MLKCSSSNLCTGNKFIYWGILHFILHFIELKRYKESLDKEIVGHFKTVLLLIKLPTKLESEGHINLVSENILLLYL